MGFDFGRFLESLFADIVYGSASKQSDTSKQSGKNKENEKTKGASSTVGGAAANAFTKAAEAKEAKGAKKAVDERNTLEARGLSKKGFRVNPEDPYHVPKGRAEGISGGPVGLDGIFKFLDSLSIAKRDKATDIIGSRQWDVPTGIGKSTVPMNIPGARLLSDLSEEKEEKMKVILGGSGSLDTSSEELLEFSKKFFEPASRFFRGASIKAEEVFGEDGKVLTALRERHERLEKQTSTFDKFLDRLFSL